MPSIDYNALSLPKGRTRRQVKARRGRAEAKVEKAVRAACVARDGYCRGRHPSSVCTDGRLACEWTGPSEWAHLPIKRRSKTRGQAPEIRHTTADSLMLCKQHHDALDGRTRPRLTIEPLTDRGADGPLRFTFRGKSYSE